MNFLKLLLGLLSTVFFLVILVILAISITIFLIFSNLNDAFSYENKFIENNKQEINKSFKSK